VLSAALTSGRHDCTTWAHLVYTLQVQQNAPTINSHTSEWGFTARRLGQAQQIEPDWNLNGAINRKVAK
jgi:hypothetical protein